MNILFITIDFSGASLCQRLHEEGNDVRAVVLDRKFADALDGIIKQRLSIEDGLDWATRDSLVVFDDCGLGDLQDELRRDGYHVVGGSEGGDKLEKDRLHAQQVFEAHGITSIPTHEFDSLHKTLLFLRSNRGPWVIKRNGDRDKTACYVGQMENSHDTIDYILNTGHSSSPNATYVLQRKVTGIEIGVARYFNGRDWVGPIEINIEHKDLFTGEIGPKTAEMGTLLWYEADENNQLFQSALAPLKTHLNEIDFRGDIDINCIVNEDGIWPLEVTPRFGYPAIQAQMALHETSWTEFLTSIARSESCDLKWKSGYALAVLMATPPFPYYSNHCPREHSPLDLAIHFRRPPSDGDWKHIHFEGVRAEKTTTGTTYRLADHTGYALHTTGHGTTIEHARNTAYRQLHNIVIPRMYFRHDIGLQFQNEHMSTLKKWGWL